jgi:hypothetical protein
VFKLTETRDFALASKGYCAIYRIGLRDLAQLLADRAVP